MAPWTFQWHRTGQGGSVHWATGFLEDPPESRFYLLSTRRYMGNSPRDFSSIAHRTVPTRLVNGRVEPQKVAVSPRSTKRQKVDLTQSLAVWACARRSCRCQYEKKSNGASNPERRTASTTTSCLVLLVPRVRLAAVIGVIGREPSL